MIVGCSKKEFTPIADAPRTREVSTLSEDLSIYDENVDVMVAFLWPSNVTHDEQREAIRSVIATSRELKNLKDSYYARRIELEAQFKGAQCDCHLNGLCGKEEPGPEDECLEIEENIYKNDRQLIPIMEKVETVKFEVLKSGGEWLSTPTDLTDMNLSQSRMDWSALSLQLTAFGTYSHQGEEIPFSYDIPHLELTPVATHVKVTFSLEKKKFQDGVISPDGSLHFDLGMKSSPHSLTFQGEILWERAGIPPRRGIIYWENPLRKL